jgi:Zinc finger C-x8-C-x5-C-x3-H type (and similar)
MRAPIDPSEPLFPVRPNEQLCQYYMKHGTCKFGQACKFHHPPQARLQASTGPNIPNGISVEGTSQLLLNPVDGNSAMMVQFLPQRPEEPDCIYYLKNGRCKYGATCRYHHPIHYHKRRVEESRRHPRGQDQYVATQTIQYVTQAAPNGTYGKGQHVIMSDSPITFLSYDGAPGNQHFQPVSVVMGADGMASYGPAVGSTMATEQASSASSIASSYDTAPAGLDTFTQGELWNRARRNGSANSLTAYTIDSSSTRTNRMIISQSPSEGNLASRQQQRLRASSYGSASESSYHDATTGMIRSASTGSWRNERLSPSYDRRTAPQYVPRPDGPQSHEQHGMRGRPPPPPMPSSHRQTSPRSRKARGNGEHDEGFTMMTSALLNMLDTPEEASTESFSDEDTMRYHHPHTIYRTQEVVDPLMFDRLSLNGPPPTSRYQGHFGKEQSDSWSPTWHGSLDGPLDSTPPSLDGNGQGLTAIPTRHAQGPHSPPSSDVGLYLP